MIAAFRPFFSHAGTALGRWTAALGVAAALLAAAPGLARAGAVARPYDVLDYDADLDPDAVTRSLHGRVTVRFVSREPGLRLLELDASDIDVEAVEPTEKGPTIFETSAGVLRITLPGPIAAGDGGSVTIRYRAHAGKGLHFYPGGFYTAFDTQEWLPCNAAPDDRATATLRWVVHPGDALVGSGEEAERIVLADGRERRTWRQPTPYPAYVLGAAAGPLRSACETSANVELCSWTTAAAAARVAPSLAVAAAVLPLLSSWAGLPYPGKRYQQVFVPDRMAQELAGMAVIREGYLQDLADDPQEDWLIIHELAHSWWGNLTTARSWNDFWLNEGIVTFIVAAAKERRWGPTGYEQEVALARRRYAKVIKSGADRPLVFDGWTRPSEMGGAVTYSKGALVMNLLRRDLGEKAFWAGLQAYTRAGAGHGVTTRDLQVAMQRASKRDLAQLFATWVFKSPAPDLVASHRMRGGDLVVTVEQRQPELARLTMNVAIETSTGRRPRTLVLRGRTAEVTFHVATTPVISVRVDDGARLPVRVKHERPVAMLLAQVEREPDVAGRLDALDQLTEVCAAPPGCAAPAAVLRRLAGSDASALMRRELKRAGDALARAGVETAAVAVIARDAPTLASVKSAPNAQPDAGARD